MQLSLNYTERRYHMDPDTRAVGNSGRYVPSSGIFRTLYRKVSKKGAIDSIKTSQTDVTNDSYLPVSLHGRYPLPHTRDNLLYLV